MTLWWISFAVIILALLALDLGVFNRRSHVIKLKEALLWTGFWTSLAMIFCGGIYFLYGHNKALEFLTGYLIEESLSVDNLFVFLLLFRYFGVPQEYEHKALFWGILMALVTRGIFIFGGVALINKFHWIIYVFGVFLVFTGIKMALNKETEVHPEKNIAIKALHFFIPVVKKFSGDKFFIVQEGRRYATPMLAVLLTLETTDIIFAVDSIPAVLAITTDPFIVYTSNVFAILGLRSLFFAISGLMKTFHFLHYGLAVILSFVGIKMLIADFYKIQTGLSLAVIAAVLALSIIASLIRPVKDVLADEKNEITVQHGE
ncbi:MAG TPA: TerC family protein [Smithellaceae bacterium]|nr:TerC family protein [Smithellaceae bacterium]